MSDGAEQGEARYAAELAQATGQLLLEYFQRDGLTGHLKKDFSLVTEADLAADRKIHAGLADAFPGDSIISEELAPSASSPSKRTWVVDPLDGTTNFSLGLPHWGVSIAFLEAGLPTAAALYFPVLDELFVASRGGGAQLNAKAIQVATAEENHGLGVLACCSRTLVGYHVALPWKKRIFGSAAYTFCALAKGSAVAALETTPRLWDIAAAWLVVEEAGGIMEPFGGEAAFPLEFGGAYSERSFATMAAASPELRDWMFESITPR